MKKETMKTCETCKHFKREQRELNYWKRTGFCTNERFRFNTIDGRLVGIYDKENKRDINKITGNPAHDIETIGYTSIKIIESRYLLQVSAKFGCIFHETK